MDVCTVPMSVVVTDCARLVQMITELQGSDPSLEVRQALGGHPLKWALALSVGALCNSILLAHTNFVSRSNEIFKGNYKSVIFREIQSELS